MLCIHWRGILYHQPCHVPTSKYLYDISCGLSIHYPKTQYIARRKKRWLDHINKETCTKPSPYSLMVFMWLCALVACDYFVKIRYVKEKNIANVFFDKSIITRPYTLVVIPRFADVDIHHFEIQLPEFQKGQEC